MKRLKEILLQAAVITLFVFTAARILDWFNPFMDFSRHAALVLTPALLLVSALLLISALFSLLRHIV